MKFVPAKTDLFDIAHVYAAANPIEALGIATFALMGLFWITKDWI